MRTCVCAFVSECIPDEDESRYLGEQREPISGCIAEMAVRRLAMCQCMRYQIPRMRNGEDSGPRIGTTDTVHTRCCLKCLRFSVFVGFFMQSTD